MTTRKKTTKKTIKKTPKEYADGKEDRKTRAKTVEELMKVNTRDPFRTATGEDFEDAVTGMNLSQLQEIAVQAGVIPSGTKATLKNKLLKEYQNKTQGVYGASSSSKPAVDPKSKRAADIIKLLNE